MWKSVVLSMASLFLAVSRAQEPSAQFRVEVDHVMVYAAVADKQGRFRTDLGRQDFSVYEDGVLQEVTHFSLEHVPLSVVCLLDTSGSMEGEKLMHAKDALVHFAERLTPQDEIALIAFDDELQQISPFTHDWKGFKRELRSVMAEGGTRLYDAVVAATEILEPIRDRRRAVLILSDGVDTASKTKFEKARQAVQRSEIQFFAIGIQEKPLGFWGRLLSGSPGGSDERGDQYLRGLTEDSGGAVYLVEDSKRCKEICIAIADELMHQYSLGYTPSHRAKDGEWRRIRIETSVPGLKVRASRSGYYARQLAGTGS